VIDAAEPVTSSGIAAGLITPVTGKRFVHSWRYATFWSTAVDFYRRIERETQTEFFREQPHRIVFETVEQQQFYARRRLHDSAYEPYVRMPLEPLDRRLFRADWGELELLQAGQLETRRYLQVCRDRWESAGKYLRAEVTAADLMFTEDCVQLPRLRVQAEYVVLCQGAAARDWPWFQPLRFQPAKGEILTLTAEVEFRWPLHRGLWLAPAESGRLRAGATYEWNQLDQEPTAAGRLELLTKLQAWVQFPLEITEQQAAVRPALFDQKPVVGLHPQWPRLGVMNGLGSKGSLQSPWLAEHLAAHLCERQPLDPEVDMRNAGRFPFGGTA